ncbi:MAG: TIGR00730 family Rossman fold protein [Planctomycetes bacterium]|nr:TIGR00730 family Rossman fold protein [Planctomycetota bacterium]
MTDQPAPLDRSDAGLTGPAHGRRQKRALKGYANPAFLGSRDARAVRLLCEYLEPLQRFQRMGVRETIVMFGSARARPEEVLKAEQTRLAEEKKKYKGALPREVSERLERLHWDAELSKYYEQARQLSTMLTTWAKTLDKGRRFVICSGGGPGIMEAANRGAHEAGGVSVGLAISLPAEEAPNSFVTPELLFEFHYFFMRKLWFMYMAAALVVFPGGFGTMDEFFEILTLVQTRKVDRPVPIVLYGKKFWQDWLKFDALIRWGTISPNDTRLFKLCDSPKEAFDYLKREMLRAYPKPLRWDGGAPQ